MARCRPGGERPERRGFSFARHRAVTLLSRPAEDAGSESLEVTTLDKRTGKKTKALRAAKATVEAPPPPLSELAPAKKQSK